MTDDDPRFSLHVPLRIRVDEPTRRALYAAAREEERPVSQLVRLAVRAYLIAHHPRLEKRRA